jgi:lipopolysaccharide/colanic/teichoic acid biosynthesis glycosyltransferase
MPIANRTSTRPVCGPTLDPAIVTNDRAPLFHLDRVAKRAFDMIAATVGLIVLSPTFLLVSIAIKIDSRGSVFRSEMLRDYYNENILLLKFRTTIVSEKEKNPPFVTRVGAILRRTGIDDIPQLINVLRGEMSIVGPSPYVAALNNIFAEKICLIQQRRRVKPGIIGWAQVHGCWGESSKVLRKRIEFDLYYIENWSFLFDIRVILMTLFSKNAYSS